MTRTKKPTTEQHREIRRLYALMEARGMKVCVHWNTCGCCVSVHEDVPDPAGGYIVDRRGGSDWYTL